MSIEGDEEKLAEEVRKRLSTEIIIPLGPEETPRIGYYCARWLCDSKLVVGLFCSTKCYQEYTKSGYRKHGIQRFYPNPEVHEAAYRDVSRCEEHNRWYCGLCKINGKTNS